MGSQFSQRQQTQSKIKRSLSEHRIAPNARLGQNFLIDFNLQRILIDSAKLTSNDVVLEVGAGTGGLTCELARIVGQVLAIELDARFLPLARATLRDLKNVELVHTDVLKNKNCLHPKVMDCLAMLFRSGTPHPCLKLVANLPYQVATPVISNLVKVPFPLESMTVTIQQEMANRLIARPSSKSYGAISVWMQALTRIQVVRQLPPSVFWPRPAVFSSILHIVPDSDLRDRIDDLDFFHSFVRHMFLHRRKTLCNTLTFEYKRFFSKSEAVSFLGSQDISSLTRAEELSVAQWVSLSNIAQKKMVRNSGEPE